MDSQALGRRAGEYLRQTLAVAYGPGGLLASHVRFDTRMPFQEGEPVSPYLAQVLDSVWGPASPKPTFAEWYYGENTLWATGWLLWSQLIRHEVTGEAEALEVARKCFRDISHVFDLSRTIEPGLLGKPHGGKPGATTSLDQSGNPVLFYAWFAQKHATAEEREQARRNLQDHGEYYLRRDWVMNHHGNLARVVEPGHTSTMKYLACAHAAYDLTGDVRFRDAALKYLRQIIAAGMIPWPAETYELNTNLMYYSLLGEYWSRTDAAKDADWIGNVGTYWKAAQAGLDDQGLLMAGVYDTKTGEFTPQKEGWYEQNPPSAGSRPMKLRWWRSPTGYSGRTMYTLAAAITGLMAQAHGHGPKAHEIARKILVRIDDDALRQYWDDGRIPEEMKPALNMFAPELPALWLVAYWMGRKLKAW